MNQKAPRSLISPLLKVVKEFKLKKILVALSGGPDSMALFHFLSQIKGLSIGVAHIDHRWRASSEKEALTLQKIAHGKNIPFHLLTLSDKPPQKNIELFGRNARLSFFKKIVKEHHYQAVFLAHHANDLAETVLKRFFEGGSLHGMEEASFFEETLFVRPWLKITKEQILSFLQENNISYFVDETNEDKIFLRGKMRSSLIPILEKEFGKGIVYPLISYSEEAIAIDAFMERQYGHLVSNPLNLKEIKDPFILKWAIKELSKNEGFTLSKEAIQNLIEIAEKNESGKKVLVKQGEIVLEKKCLYFKKHN